MAAPRRQAGRRAGEARLHLRFCGAARTVTGSCYLLQTPEANLLIDCGMFQGSKTIRSLNYQSFPFEPAGIDAVLLTHAHIDHSGLLPKLVRHGFDGPIHATQGTCDLLTYMLPDSGYIQEMEVEHLNRRNQRRGQPTVAPIYTKADAERCLKRLRAIALGEWRDVAPNGRARYWNAGHILGSASIEVEIRDRDDPVTLLFSGDLGPQEKAFHADPEAPAGVDYLVVESTYGNRDRADVDVVERRQRLGEEVGQAMAAGGNLVIPVFAVERTQELLYDLALLIREGVLSKARIFLDSPLAIRATSVFAKHADTLEEGAAALRHAFDHRRLQLVHSADESRRLEGVTSGAIILSASGMCEAGRVRHHLKHNLWRRESTVLFVGYQAPGTLGDLILSGTPKVRIQGEEIDVRARVRSIDSYSAHADATELVAWVCQRLPVRHGIFLTHGEEASIAALKEGLIAAGIPAHNLFVPRLDELFDLPACGRTRHVLEAPRLTQREIAPTDWHNDYAALLVELPGALGRLPDDVARRRLLRDIRRRLSAP